jgi:hypothetical protein
MGFATLLQQRIEAKRPAAGEDQIKKHETEQDRGLAAYSPITIYARLPP